MVSTTAAFSPPATLIHCLFNPNSSISAPDFSRDSIIYMLSFDFILQSDKFIFLRLVVVSKNEQNSATASSFK